MKNISPIKFIPVIFAFLTMAYSDIVGIAINYIKQDFALSDRAANAFGMAVFFWFLVASVPTGILMNKIGRRRTVAISTGITCAAMLVPAASYSELSMALSFAMLGIGNTMLQVSINPLVADMVSGRRLAASLTFGQFAKSIASFATPILVIMCAKHFGSWRNVYPVLAALSLIPTLSLALTKIVESAPAKTSSFIECLGLLKIPAALLLFSGILVHVGVDVGMNITAPKILMERAGFALEQAGYATSLYFFFRIAASFAGAIILAKVSAKKFFAASVGIMLAASALLFFAQAKPAIYAAIALLGIGNANIFSVIFTKALQLVPERKNEMSALMVMGIAGGGIFPYLMGVASDAAGSQSGAVAVIFACVAYLAAVAFKLKKDAA